MTSALTFPALALAHPGLTYDQYAALPGLRSSQLKQLRESPAHYRRPPPRKGWSVDLRLIHAMVLEPEEVARSWVRFDGTRRGSEWERCKLGNFGKEIATGTEWDRAAATAEAIRTDENVAPLLDQPGESELSITWTRVDGVPCKLRLDRWVDGERKILDVKTYGSTDDRIVMSRADKLGAYLQAAHYLEGAHHAFGPDPIRYGLVVAESASPYDVCIFWLTDEAIETAAAERERLIARLLDCQASGRWPGRHDGPQELGPPVWRLDEDMDDITVGETDE